MKIYVAGSWKKSVLHEEVVRELKKAGFEVYDFKHPTKDDNGFHWSDIDPKYKEWTASQFKRNLEHPIANNGFAKDFSAMMNADACVLVLPSGRSSHLEAGWFIGEGKPVLILLSDGEPELMYKMAEGVCLSIFEVVKELERIENKNREREDRTYTFR